MATLTTSWQEVASATPYSGFHLKLYLKYNSQNITANTSSVSAEFRIVCASGTSAHCYTHSCNFGESFNASSSVGSYYHGWESGTTTTILSQTITVTHDNTTGKASVKVSGAFSASNGINQGAFSSASWDLPTIPRNFSKAPILTITSTEEQKVSLSWTTSETCNRIQFFYKVKGTDTWSSQTASTISPAATTGTATITGLNANTAYDMKINCRRSIFSQAADPTMDSNVISDESSKTYSFPFVKLVSGEIIALEAPDSANVSKTVTINNELLRENIKVYAKLNNGNVINNGTGYVTASISQDGVTTATLPLGVNLMYANIGESATTGNIEYYCVYTETTGEGQNAQTVDHQTAPYGQGCKTVEANCCPTYGTDTQGGTVKETLTYENLTTTDADVLGHDDQYIIQNHSNLKISGPTYIARSHAGTSLKQIIYTWNGVQIDAGLNSSINRGLVQESSNVNISMWAIDKRGYKSAVTTATVKVIPYEPPKFTVTSGRTGNYEAGTGMIILTAIRSPLRKTAGGTDYNGWIGDGQGHISCSISPDVESASQYTFPSYIDNTGTTIEEYQISIGAGALNTENPYTITFNYGDKLGGLSTTTRIEQAISPFDFNIQTGALGINVPVNKDNVAPGLYATGLYIEDKNTAVQSKIESSNITLGKKTTVTNNNVTTDVYSNVSVVGYEALSAKAKQTNYTTSKSGTTHIATDGYFSSEVAHNQKINGELYLGGQLSTTQYGKLYLFDGTDYIPIMWYQNNSSS